jgi:hypothetical protein
LVMKPIVPRDSAIPQYPFTKSLLLKSARVNFCCLHLEV